MATAEQKLALSELYIAFFNRAPEFEGFNYWVERLDGGTMSLQSMAADWWNTQAETKSTYPTSLSTEAFVEKIYTNVLGRDTDPEGKTFWVDKINKGLILRENFIMSVIEGAKAPTGGVSDRQYLANKAEVGVYFAEQHAPSSEASSVLDSVTDDTASVQSSKELIERNFRPSFEQLTTQYQSNIIVTYDTSLVGEEKTYVQNYMNDITAILTEITGFNPHKTITIKFDPSAHIGFNDAGTILNLDAIPSQDAWFKSRFTVNITHLYVEEQDLGDVKTIPLYENNLRSTESNSQTIATIIAHEYGDALGWSSLEKIFYESDYNQDWDQAFENLLINSNPFSIYQTDTNYNMNSTSLSATTHSLLSLYKLDKDFYKNMYSTPPSWQSYDEYKDVIINSIHTLSYNEAKEVVNELLYFKQIDALNSRPDMNIEIALFSTTDFPELTTNKQFAFDSPNGFIIYGQSYNPEVNPLGTPVWNIVPDPLLYDSTAIVKVFDSTGKTVYTNNSADIKADFANGWSGNLSNIVQDGMAYTITAEATINGVLLTDTLSFTYHL